MRMRWTRSCVQALAVWVTLTGATAQAAVDLAQSHILVSPATPLESDIVSFTVVLRNTGDEPADAVHVEAQWPLMGFLVDVSPVDGETFAPPVTDHGSRTVTLSLPLPAGAERRFTIRVLAPRDSGGDTLSTALRLAHYRSGTNHYLTEAVTIDTRVATTGVRLGGARIAPAGLGVLGVLSFGLLLWALLSSAARRSPGARRASATRAHTSGPAASSPTLSRRITAHMSPAASAIAITVAVGFWTMFASMAWRDYRSLTAWPRTTCTVLGGRLSAQGTTKTTAAGGMGAAATDNTLYVPVLGLRYAVNGQETFSTGFDTGSRLGVGPRGGRIHELDGMTIGATTDCWYNADDPLDVVVINGFGGAYVFALVPLPLFLLGLWRAKELLAS